VTRPVGCLFLGSGGFAVPIVTALAEIPEVTLLAVVTAPPRPSGRGQRTHPSAVGEWAAAAGIETLTPARLRAPESLAAIAAFEPELLVLADYGQIVPQALLDLPRHGALNIHPSLLPRHRGATPIPSTILEGDPVAGVTLMRMDAGMDTGPLIAQRTVPLVDAETGPELEARLAAAGADLLRDSLAGWLSGELPAVPQPEEGVTVTRPLRRIDGWLDPGRGAVRLARQVRAYQPWPGTYSDSDEGRLTVWRAQPLALGLPPVRSRDGGIEGTLLPDGDGLALAVADGALRLTEVQIAGGRRMSSVELRRGRPRLVGSRLRDPRVG
jgi:methionyl-tRNA formyltransferase